MKKRMILIGSILIFLVGALLASAPDFELKTNRYLPFYNLQAQAFLSGHTAMPIEPDWFNDVITFEGKKYLAIPPLNGFLSMPLVAAFGASFPERIFTLAVFLCFIFTLSKLIERFSMPLSPKRHLTWLVFFTLGTCVLNCTVKSTPWFSAVLVASLFTTLALLTYARAKKLRDHMLAVALICIAAMGRTHLILLTIPFILIPWIKNYRFKKKELFLLATPGIAFLFYFTWWNWARFGTPFDLHYHEHGYGSVFGKDITNWGFTNIRYIAAHFYHGLFGLPKPALTFPFFEIDPFGSGLFAISPLFLFVIFRKRKYEPIDWFLLICTVIVAIPVFTHFSTGWSQFGYRYSLDALPFLGALLLRSQFDIWSPLSIGLIAISLWYQIFGTLLDVGVHF